MKAWYDEERGFAWGFPGREFHTLVMLLASGKAYYLKRIIPKLERIDPKLAAETEKELEEFMMAFHTLAIASDRSLSSFEAGKVCEVRTYGPNK